jgi:hypothetical protein
MAGAAGDQFFRFFRVGRGDHISARPSKPDGVHYIQILTDADFAQTPSFRDGTFAPLSGAHGGRRRGY